MLQEKKRNYTIEFLRFMFAINFLMIHALFVFPKAYLMGAVTNTNLFMSSFDVIVPFMGFAGYFMMASFKKNQAKALLQNTTAGRQSWLYLKERLVTLLPIMTIALLLGFVSNRIWNGTPVSEWGIYLVNSIGEFLGLQIVGIGMGNASVGLWGTAAPTELLLNTPIWFISGLFIVGYFMYYLLVKHEKSFVTFIIPGFLLLYFGSMCLVNASTSSFFGGTPMWTDVVGFGNSTGIGAVAGMNPARSIAIPFVISQGVLEMFAGLSIGILCWVICDNLKDVKFSRGFTWLLNVISLALLVFVIIKSFVSAESEWYLNNFNIGWMPTYILTSVFTLLVLLNRDFINSKLLNHKIWKYPGKLSFYVYMIHFPVIIFVGMFMGLSKAAVMPGVGAFAANVGTLGAAEALKIAATAGPQFLTSLTIGTLAPIIIQVMLISIAVTIVLAILLMMLDVKVIRPFLKKSPWKAKEKIEAVETVETK